MIRHVISVTAAALFLTLASACATGSGTTASSQPEAQPLAAAPAQQSAAADPAVAPTKVATTDPAAKKEFHPDDMVCRVYEVTGTRIGKQRICKTRAQWIEAARAAQEAMRSITSPSAQPGGDQLVPGGTPR